MSKQIIHQHRDKSAVDSDSPRANTKPADITHDGNQYQHGERKDSGHGSVDGSRTSAEDDETHRLPLGALVPVSLVRSFYELSALDVDGKMVQFSRFEGRVTLVVNVARPYMQSMS